MVQTLARGLVASGHRASAVGIYSRERSDSWTWDEGVRVVRLSSCGRPGLGAILDARRLWRFVRAYSDHHGVDIVDGPELTFVLAPVSHDVPRVVRMHGGHHFFGSVEGSRLSAGTALAERISVARADKLVAVSRYVAEETRGHLGLGGRPIAVIPNPRARQSSSRSGRSVVPGSILFFGSLCEKKGVRQLIDAFPAILEGFPSATLTLAGRDTATSPGGGSFLEHALRHVDPVARRRITWLGHVPNVDIDALIERSHVCVLPSLLESFGVAWLEVMSMGRPLVASSVGPSREIIDEGTDGLLCNPHDPRSISEATLALLRDDVLAERVSRNARESSDRFALEPIVRRNLQLYDDAISSFSPSLEREVGRCMKQVVLALPLLAQHRR